MDELIQAIIKSFSELMDEIMKCPDFPKFENKEDENKEDEK